MDFPEWRIGRRVRAMKKVTYGPAYIDLVMYDVDAGVEGVVLYYHRSPDWFTVAWASGQTTFKPEHWGVLVEAVKEKKDDLIAFKDKDIK